MFVMTEYDTDVKSIMKDLLQKHSTLEKTMAQLKNTELDLNRARDLKNSADPDSSGSASKLEPPVSEWLLVNLKLSADMM